jgi:hypothetical protein
MYKFLLVLVLLAGCSATEHRKVMSPPPKPVCPQGIKDNWCRPLAANEKGITNLGNQADEE